jgi:rhomboid protease GluP
MSKGLPSIHISAEGLGRAETIALLLRAFRELRWYPEHLHPLRVVATVPQKGSSKEAKVEIEFREGGFMVTSKPTGWSPFAPGKRHQRNIEALAEAFASARDTTTPGEMTAELRDLEESGVMAQDPASSHANELTAKDHIGFLVPKAGFFATPVLIDASLLVYIIMVVGGVSPFQPDVEDLMTWGANFREGTLGGEWWRSLSCCFVHIGLFHLLFNMYALGMIGLHLEPLLGRGRVFALYVLTGIAASITSLWWNENTVSAGASGAVFGLYGVFLALLLTDLIHKDVRKPLLRSIGLFVVYNLVMGIKGGIDNAAHIGGLVTGLVCGAALYPVLRDPMRASAGITALALPAIGVAVAGWWMLGALPQGDREFHRAMEEFLHWEEEGMAMYHLPGESDGADQLRVLEERSLPAWDSAHAVLHRLRGSDLSPHIERRLGLLLEYTTERRTNTGMVRRALSGEEQDLDAAIERSFLRIDSIVTLLEE